MTHTMCQQRLLLLAPPLWGHCTRQQAPVCLPASPNTDTSELGLVLLLHPNTADASVKKTQKKQQPKKPMMQELAQC